jgi:hypothetical protein
MVVCIESGSLSAEQLEAEFKDLVDDEWDWQVQKLSKGFCACLPFEGNLAHGDSRRGLKLPTSKCHALVVINTGDPSATEHLVEVKVKLFGVPASFRYSNRLLVGTRELGRPLTVNEDSLADTNGPVRITIACRTPIQLPGSLLLFVNMEGFRVRVVREGGAAVLTDAPPPPPPKPAVDDDDDTRPTRMLTVGTAAEGGTTVKTLRAKACRNRGRRAVPAGNQ